MTAAGIGKRGRLAFKLRKLRMSGFVRRQIAVLCTIEWFWKIIIIMFIGLKLKKIACFLMTRKRRFLQFIKPVITITKAAA